MVSYYLKDKFRLRIMALKAHGKQVSTHLPELSPVPLSHSSTLRFHNHKIISQAENIPGAFMPLCLLFLLPGLSFPTFST